MNEANVDRSEKIHSVQLGLNKQESRWKHVKQVINETKHTLQDQRAR